MTEAEKQEVLRVLRETRNYMAPYSAKRIAETQHLHDEMMKSISRITYPDLQADLTAQAMKVLSYVDEHKAPLDALDKAIAHAEQTNAAELTRERVREIAQESGWLELRNF